MTVGILLKDKHHFMVQPGWCIELLKVHDMCVKFGSRMSMDK